MKELLQIAVRAAFDAGNAILKHYDNYDLKYKTDKSPLTSADLAANEAIFTNLIKTQIPICSEEQILVNDDISTFWLVDPMDGTREFIKKNGQFCVCIALIQNAKPTLGVIFIPLKNEIFFTLNGQIYKNDILLNTSNLGDKTIICSNQTTNNGKTAKFATKFGLNLNKCGSAIKFCHLVSGNASVYLRISGSNIWDIAAGDCLLRNSGGAVICLKTKKPFEYSLKNLKNDYFIALNSHQISNLTKYLDYLDQKA
nr:3'(2'),5'-bisphosphate nucleotidase CysQ [Campylobacter sp.]